VTRLKRGRKNSGTRRAIQLFADLVEIDGGAGPATFGAPARLAAEAFINQPGYIKGSQNKNQENNELLYHVN
jgi:hypothetical protein